MQCLLLKFQFLLIAIIIADHSKLSQVSPVKNQNNEPPETWQEFVHTGKYNNTRVYLNPNDSVAIYLTSKNLKSFTNNWFTAIESPSLLFNFTSSAWAYMKGTYGEFGPNPYLYLVFHPQCSFVSPNYEYSINPNSSRNLLHIPFPNSKSLEKNITQNETLDLLANAMAYFVERSSKQRFGTPYLSFKVWKLPNRALNYTATDWSDIFTFDLYTNLNLPAQAERYRAKVLNSVDIDLTSKVWFRDWFLPIYNYSKNGIEGNGNAVLNRYFEILSFNDPQIDVNYGRKYELNMGWFVHFWSAAANADLRELAKKTAFGWNDEYEQQFQSARQDFPYNYTDSFFNATESKTVDTTARESDAGKGTKKAVSTNAIVGTAIIVILIGVLIASFIFYKKKIQNLKSEIRALTTEEVTNFFEGDGTVREDEANEALVLSMPFIKDFEIPRDQMILDQTKVLGTGQFGTVIHGFLRQSETDPLMSVAMKTVKPNVDVACFKAFLSEVKIMAYLGRHDNIVDLLGTCTTNIKNREIFIALEFCPRGNLLDYLKNNRNNFQSTRKGALDQPPEVEMSTVITSGTQNIITNTDLIRWSHEISNAMMYLTVKKVIHGDLAARNILLTKDRTAKISDFGLSRQFLNYANYMKTSKIPVPWRWLAIESLKEMNFSTASDVWAFGVTMWEIFSLGEVPYGAWTFDLFFADKLVAGDRLLIPTHATQSIYEMMKDCWQIKPGKRPKFQEIHNLLGQMIGTPRPTESKNSGLKKYMNEEDRLLFDNEMETQL